MDSEHSVKGTLLVLICYVSYSLQVPHEFIVEDERIFSDCINAPPGSWNISGLYDLSHMTFTMDEHGTLLEGNVTAVWNIQPTDVLLTTLLLEPFYMEIVLGLDTYATKKRSLYDTHCGNCSGYKWH